MTHQITEILPSCKQSVGLYIVSTPIGNLDDITLRALTTLKNVDFIACEDTRVTAKLLNHYKINTKTLCYNDFSTEYDRKTLIQKLADGYAVALVSDAGTPLISDPGYKLIKAVKEARYPVITIPGACAAIAALTLSGLPTDRFFFAGFLPAKTVAKEHAIQAMKHIHSTLVFYESPRRLIETLILLKQYLGDKDVTVARELTKQFEEAICGTLSEVIDYYQNHICKGECVITLSNIVQQEYSEAQLDQLILESLEHSSAKDTAAAIADMTELPRKQIYDRILKLRRNT